MSEQLSLNFENRFREFHRANPEIYDWFKKFAFEKINAGAKQIGAKAIWERIRWESPVKANGEAFALNNIYTPFYARLFMREFPKYVGIFETRTAKADVEGVI